MPNETGPIISNKLSGLKKHQQVAQTNRQIFGWVVAASVVVAICVVLSQFLVQQLLFNAKIIDKKSETSNIVQNNITAAETLKEKVDALVMNTNLQKVVSSNQSASTTNNLQVILDALPTEDDGETLANSLATAILPRSNIKITSLTAGNNSGGEAIDTSVAPDVVGETPFSFTVEGTYDDIKDTLANIARVIRPMTIKSLSLRTGTGGTMAASVEGVTYFLPSSSVKLGTQEVKP